jgi:hypothetical protein
MRDIIEIKKKIKAHVNAIDPWHLIEGGAPEDEYNSYIDHIVSLVVNNKPDQASLLKELSEIFKTKEFELDQNKMKDLAEKICNISE